jgi:hypothetical protein
MTMSNKIGIFLVAVSVSLFVLSIPGVQSFVSTAEARVGRPLTPVSGAGVARRTVRRCAAGVYDCY